MKQPHITHNEWLWAAVMGTLVLLVTFVPYVSGWLNSTPERVFAGSVYMQADAYSYLVQIRLGVRGYWLFHDMFAVEPHNEALLYLPYVVVGQIVRLLAGERAHVGALITAFHTWRVLADAFLMWTLYRFYATLLSEPRQRRWAYGLSLAGGGLGGVMALSGLGVLWGNRPLDLYLGEAYGFVALFTLPHVVTARACMLWAIMRLARFMGRPDNRSWMLPGDPQNALLAGLLWLVMALCVPFYILVAAVVTAVWVVIRTIRTRVIPRRAVLWGGLSGVPGGLAIVTNLIMMGDDPVYAAWNAQNLLPAPHILHFVFAFGLPLAFAVVGVRVAWRARYRLAGLAISWLIAAALLMFIPVNVQVRLLEGAHIPLWGLAALGLDHLRTRLSRRVILNWAVSGAFLTISLLSTAFLVIGGAVLPLERYSYVFVSGDEVSALEWLNAYASFETVLLASEDVGIYAPARAGIRVVLGHGFETPYHAERQGEVAAFYSGDMTNVERVALLTKYGVRYVYVGPDERAIPCELEVCVGDPFDPAVLDLQEVCTWGQVTLYEVGR